MGKTFLTLILALIVGVLAISTAQGALLIGTENVTFSTDGETTTINFELESNSSITFTEGSGGGGATINSNLTIIIRDDTVNLPNVEIQDDQTTIFNVTLTKNEVAEIVINDSNSNTLTVIHIRDNLNTRSAWITLSDYTCDGDENVRKFQVYKESPGFPQALIFSWTDTAEECEQLIVPLNVHKFPL